MRCSSDLGCWRMPREGNEPSWALLWGLSKASKGFCPRRKAGRSGSPQISAEWGCGSRDQKMAGEAMFSVRAEKVQSGQYEGSEQPWNFLVAVSAYLKCHITMSNYSSFTLTGHCWQPVCSSLCGVGVHITETRASWCSSSNITSEPDSLHAGSAASKKLWLFPKVYQTCFVTWTVRPLAHISAQLQTLLTRLDLRTGPAL